MQSDQEKSIEDVKKDTSRKGIADGQSTTQESSAVGDSDANGKTEKKHPGVKWSGPDVQVGTRGPLGCTITINHPIFPWMVRHASQLVIRYQVRGSGKTSYRMGKGVDSILPVA